MGSSGHPSKGGFILKHGTSIYSVAWPVERLGHKAQTIELLLSQDTPKANRPKLLQRYRSHDETDAALVEWKAKMCCSRPGCFNWRNLATSQGVACWACFTGMAWMRRPAPRAFDWKAAGAQFFDVPGPKQITHKEVAES